MAITRTDLSREGALRAFPKLSKPGALALGQTVFSIIASLPPGRDGCDAFLLDDGDTTISVVLSHDRAAGKTCIVLYEKHRGEARHAAANLFRAARRAGLVPAEQIAVAVAGTEGYGFAVKRMDTGFEMPPEPGFGGQYFLQIDLDTLGD